MFIYSVRASTIKFFAVIILVIALMISVITVGAEDAVYTSADGSEINYGGIKTKEDRIAFIKQFGIEINEDSEKAEKFRLPENFDRVILGYNQLQVRQGLNLSKYAKKRITHYSYEVTNFKDGEEVYVNLLVYKNKIIACDISSLKENGFVLPLSEVEENMLNNN